VTYRFSLAS